MSLHKKNYLPNDPPFSFTPGYRPPNNNPAQLTSNFPFLQNAK